MRLPALFGYQVPFQTALKWRQDYTDKIQDNSNSNNEKLPPYCCKILSTEMLCYNKKHTLHIKETSVLKSDRSELANPSKHIYINDEHLKTFLL